MLSATSAARMSRTTRIANWPDVCRVALTNAVHRTSRQPEREPDRETRDRAEHDEHERRDVGVAAAEEDRDRDERTELADRPDGADRPAEGRPQLARVAQDRQDRAERRRAQRDADDDRLLAGRDQPAHPDADREADEPPEDRDPTGAAAE